jgi:hypothetical protein
MSNKRIDLLALWPFNAKRNETTFGWGGASCEGRRHEECFDAFRTNMSVAFADVVRRHSTHLQAYCRNLSYWKNAEEMSSLSQSAAAERSADAPAPLLHSVVNKGYFMFGALSEHLAMLLKGLEHRVHSDDLGLRSARPLWVGRSEVERRRWMGSIARWSPRQLFMAFCVWTTEVVV